MASTRRIYHWATTDTTAGLIYADSSTVAIRIPDNDVDAIDLIRGVLEARGLSLTDIPA